MSSECPIGRNNCVIGSYCTLTSPTTVSCKPCDFSIPIGLGCNCIASVGTPNCVACDAGTCSACNNGFALTSAKTCAECQVQHCAKCLKVENCYECVFGYRLNGENICDFLCEKDADCGSGEVCDVVAKVCGEKKKIIEGIILPGGAIAGIVLGVLILLILVVLLVYYFYKKFLKEKKENDGIIQQDAILSE